MANWQMIVGGGLQGLGSGLAQQGAMLREARLAELDRKSRDQRQAEQQEFQRSEREAGQNFRRELADTERQYQSERDTAKTEADKPLQEARIRLMEAQAAAAEDPSSRNTSAAVQARNDLARIYAQAEPKTAEETDQQFQQRVAKFILQTETQRAGMSEDDLMAKAIQAAQKDPDWQFADTTQKRELVNSYVSLLKGKSSETGPSNNDRANKDALKAIEDGKISREEARKRLREAGFTPTF